MAMKKISTFWKFSFFSLLIIISSCEKHDVEPTVEKTITNTSDIRTDQPIFIYNAYDTSPQPTAVNYVGEEGKVYLCWGQYSTILHRNDYPQATTVTLKLNARIDDRDYVYYFYNKPVINLIRLPSDGFYSHGIEFDTNNITLKTEDGAATYRMEITPAGPNTSLQFGNNVQTYDNALGGIQVRDDDTL